MHKYVIAIYLVEDCLGIVFDTEQEMNNWLEMLNSCHMGGRSIGKHLYVQTLQTYVIIFLEKMKIFSFC